MIDLRLPSELCGTKLSTLMVIICLLLSASNCWAEKISLGNVPIEIPIIDGFEKIEPNSEQFSYLAYVPDYMKSRVLVLALAPSEIVKIVNNGALIHKGHFILFRKDSLSEFQNYSKRRFNKEFSELASSTNLAIQKLDWGNISNRNIDGNDLKIFIKQNINIGRAKIIEKAVFNNGVYSFTMLGNSNTGEKDLNKTTIMIIKTLAIRVKGKIVYIYIHKIFNEKKNLEEVNRLCRQLIMLINSAN